MCPTASRAFSITRATQDTAAKVATARTLWVPAVNNHGGLGRWAFLEIADPWDAKNSIRGCLTGPEEVESTP